MLENPEGIDGRDTHPLCGLGPHTNIRNLLFCSAATGPESLRWHRSIVPCVSSDSILHYDNLHWPPNGTVNTLGSQILTVF